MRPRKSRAKVDRARKRDRLPRMLLASSPADAASVSTAVPADSLSVLVRASPMVALASSRSAVMFDMEPLSAL